MWVLVLILVVLVLFLGLGYARLLSALKDLREQIQKKLQSGSGVRLTSQVSKKELVALTKQVSDLFDQIERTNRIAFQEKKTLDMAISNIAHDIRTPLTIASGYTQQIIKGGTQEEEKLKKMDIRRPRFLKCSVSAARVIMIMLHEKKTEMES